MCRGRRKQLAGRFEAADRRAWERDLHRLRREMDADRRERADRTEDQPDEAESPDPEPVAE